MTLRQARCAYSIALATLILRAGDYGLEIAIDEVTDRVTEKDPTTDHMKGSLHEIGLAADLLLYRNGVYLTSTEDYRKLGELWEQMGKQLGLDLAWGGHFSKPDGNHFSLRWNGKA
jgi:hypothetical protein